ncbi:MAG: DUF4386 family protein [Methanobacteriota archaeon]|nr:MAG: DUF4386 family protein [Euryarchaeota archaeon]
MAEASSGGCRGESGSRLAGVSGILFGILLIATFASSYNFPSGPAQADATLAQFSSFRSAFLAGDIFIGLAAVIAIPYFVGLRAAFNGKDRLLVGSATLMGVVGIVVTAAVFIGEAITLDVLSGPYATGGVSKTVAVIVAQAVIGFGTVEVFGFLTLAAGFAVYGFTTIQGRPFPRWLGYVGILGAVLFLLGAVPVSGAFTAIFAGTVLILVWIFATSVLMWKSGAPRATP